MKTRKLTLILSFGLISFYTFCQRSLNVPYESQIQTNVCWAASMKMIINVHGDTRDQCFINDYVVDIITGSSQLSCDCLSSCGNGDARCNIPLRHPIPRIRSYLQPANLGFGSSSGSINWLQMTGEIDIKRPFITIVDKSHIVVAKGYVIGTGFEKSLIINDPLNCDVTYKEVFVYNNIDAVYNILRNGDNMSSVPYLQRLDTCQGSIRRKLSQSDMDNLVGSLTYDSVRITNSSSKRKQMIYCDKSCNDKYIVTTFELENANLWRPIFIAVQTEGCNTVRVYNGRKIGFSNNNSKVIGADTTIRYQKVVLYPYNNEVYVFELDGRILYTPAHSNFFELKRGIFYTPTEVMKEYSRNVYIDYEKNDVEYKLPNAPLPVFPDRIEDLFLKTPIRTLDYNPYLKDFRKFDKFNNTKALQGQLKNYPFKLTGF